MPFNLCRKELPNAWPRAGFCLLSLSLLVACGGNSGAGMSTDSALHASPPSQAASVVVTANSSPSGRAQGIPIGIENVNDSPLKASNYQALIRFVPIESVTIDRFYFGFKLRGASCEPANAGYGAGDGGTLRASVVEIDQTTGLPTANVIASETVNACDRYREAKSELNGATPVVVWINTAASFDAGKMYGVIIRNLHPDPSNNFFSFNMPLADTALAGPHTRNELDMNAAGAMLSLDPREHVAWSENDGQTWQYGSMNGQYRSYMNNRDKAHPATRLPQYGFRLSNGQGYGAQPYYAYSTDCIACTTAYANVRYARTFTQVGGFIASGNDVGTLTLTNTSTGQSASCTPELGYGLRTCELPTPVMVLPGQSYQIASTGAVEIMKMDYSQRYSFPQVGTTTGELRAYQPYPAPKTNKQDVPSLWAGPLSPYFE